MENKKLWFKAKRFGWGWTPCSWEGWVILALYTVATTLHFINVDKFAHSGSDVLISFAVPFIINTVFLLIICYAKGETPRWRWYK